MMKRWSIAIILIMAMIQTAPAAQPRSGGQALIRAFDDGAEAIRILSSAAGDTVKVGDTVAGVVYVINQAAAGAGDASQLSQTEQISLAKSAGDTLDAVLAELQTGIQIRRSKRVIQYIFHVPVVSAVVTYDTNIAYFKIAADTKSYFRSFVSGDTTTVDATTGSTLNTDPVSKWGSEVEVVEGDSGDGVTFTTKTGATARFEVKAYLRR